MSVLEIVKYRVRSFFFLVAVPEVPDLVPILICLVGYLSCSSMFPRGLHKFSELFGYKFQGSEQLIRNHLVPSPSCSGLSSKLSSTEFVISSCVAVPEPKIWNLCKLF